MHARSALFDVYGDHLRTRGNQAPVAASGAAARAGRDRARRPSARRSRGWCSQGWLEPVHAAGGPRATAATDAGRSGASTTAADRIYRRRARPLGRPLAAGVRRPRPPTGPARAPAARGPGLPRATPSSATGVWVSPWPRAEARRPLARAAPAPRRDGPADVRPADSSPPAPGTSTRLARVVRRVARRPPTALVEADARRRRRRRRTRRRSPARFHLVHEWRKFLFTDPGLPAELLPARLAGPGGADALHHARPTRLEPGRRPASWPAASGR